MRSRHSSVSIATKPRAGRTRFESRQGAARPPLGPTQPPIQWVPGALFTGVKRPVREADYSPPSSAEVKNAWHCNSTPPYVFMLWCLVKHRANLHLPFTFTSSSAVALHVFGRGLLQSRASV
jgi:hypothetical protein